MKKLICLSALGMLLTACGGGGGSAPSNPVVNDPGLSFSPESRNVVVNEGQNKSAVIRASANKVFQGR